MLKSGPLPDLPRLWLEQTRLRLFGALRCTQQPGDVGGDLQLVEQSPAFLDQHTRFACADDHGPVRGQAFEVTDRVMQKPFRIAQRNALVILPHKDHASQMFQTQAGASSHSGGFFNGDVILSRSAAEAQSLTFARKRLNALAVRRRRHSLLQQTGLKGQCHRIRNATGSCPPPIGPCVPQVRAAVQRQSFLGAASSVASTCQMC